MKLIQTILNSAQCQVNIPPGALHLAPPRLTAQCPCQPQALLIPLPLFTMLETQETSQRIEELIHPGAGLSRPSLQILDLLPDLPLPGSTG